MPRIYVSSTAKDLEAHRHAVIDALQAMRQNVAAMEYYVAQDGRPADVCVRDVEASDIYVGIFGWRYGSTVPWGEPERPVSITELEYRAAEKKTRLIFLLDQSAPWPDEYKDAASGENGRGERIGALREELARRHIVRFFSTPDALALQVTLSLFNELALDKPKKFDLPEGLTEMQDIQGLGSSLMPEIVEKIRHAARDAKGMKCVEVNLGVGQSWWSTRLYLLASLAVDFTQIRRIVFVDGDERFIGMASPRAVKRALGVAQPSLQALYQEGRYGDDPEYAIVYAITNSRVQIQNTLIPESELKAFVTVDKLKQWLLSGLEQGAVSTAVEAQENVFLAYKAINEPADFVAVVQPGGRLLGVVDRLELSVRIARTELERHMNQLLRRAG